MREKEGGGESKTSFEIQRGRGSTICEDKAGRMGGELRKEYRGREEEGRREKRMRGRKERRKIKRMRKTERLLMCMCTCV